MVGGIDWFRWHHGSVTDPKFQLIARRADVRLSDVLAVWAFLLEKASAAEFRSHFGEIDCEAVDCLFGFNDGETGKILTQMQDRKLIADEYIVAWERRQPKRERDDNSSERVAKHRATKHQPEPRNSNVTPCNAMQRQETPRGEEIREDSKPPISPIGEIAPPSKSINFKTWIQQTKAKGENAILGYTPVFDYCESVGIPNEWLELAWLSFKDRYLEDEKAAKKKYVNWRRVFLRAVKENWFSLWFFRDGKAVGLTTVGQQSELEHREVA